MAANLPYVRSDVMASLPTPTTFEPAEALDGGPDGLAVIACLLTKLPDGLVRHGVVFLRSARIRETRSWRWPASDCRAGPARSRRTSRVCLHGGPPPAPGMTELVMLPAAEFPIRLIALESTGP